MKSFYYRKLPVKPAVADVFQHRAGAALITRINVPIEHRCKGIGTSLLEEIIADADEEGVILHIEVQPSGGPTREQLKDWYMKFGFMPSAIYDYFLIRQPNTS